PCDENGQFLPPGTCPPKPQYAPQHDWSPYRDRVAFETAERLYAKDQMSATGIDALMNLWHASFIQSDATDAGAPFLNHKDLYATIDSTQLGNVAWQSFSLSYDGKFPDHDVPSWMEDKFDVWFRDPRLIVKNIVSNMDFANEFDYVPFRKFDAEGKQIWENLMSGSWAWTQADTIAKDAATHGSMFVPLILGSDKTTVSVATGQNEYYPLYLSIGNVHNRTRREHRNALSLIAFLAIPKTDKRHSNNVGYRHFRRGLFHRSLAQILHSLKPYMTTFETMRCPDGHYRRVIYGLGPYIADYPEQVHLTCIVQGWCPRCMALPEFIGVSGLPRSSRHTNGLMALQDMKLLWEDYGIIGNIIPFTDEFPRADIYDLIAPDILHQLIKGVFKDHLVTWVEEYLVLTYGQARANEILDDIDRRIRAVPPFPKLRRFPQGRGFKQWTGDDSKALMKVYLPAIEGHVPDDMLRTFRAFLEFCYLVRRNVQTEDTVAQVEDAIERFHRYRIIFQTTGVRHNGFSLPRQHSIAHYPNLIRMFGAPNGLCSSMTEAKHIKAVKEPWWRSSRNEPLGQMLLTNQRLDKLAAARNDFTMRKMLEGSVLMSVSVSDNDPSGAWPVNDPLTPPRLTPNTPERGYPKSVDELSIYLGQPRLLELIRRFLHAQLNPPPDDDTGLDIPLSSCPQFDANISIFHSATSTFHSPSDPSGIKGMCREVIRSAPHWRNKGPRRDCVFVEYDTKFNGMRGLEVVRVLAFMSFVSDDIVYPCALVQWFTHLSEEPDELTGMWMVQADRFADGSPVISVIHTDCIIRGAHLIPIFGKDFIPTNVHFSESLDNFAAFYVNRFIDHHAFETIF
ncbi:hypothetical protein BC826DRAFT_917322, partial [Russula brevipes]